MVEGRGFLDGATLTHRKGQRGVDVIIPLKSNMHAYREAVSIAEMEAAWEPHPSRRAHVIVYAGGYFEIFETFRFVRLVLGLTAPVQERLRSWLDEHISNVKKQE